MMTNLFSSFDPCSSTWTTMNWISTIMYIALIPNMVWMTPNRHKMTAYYLTMSLNKELTLNLSQKSTLMALSTFLTILMNNTLGLIPYMFTSPSHLMFSVSLSLPLWTSLTMFGWWKQTKKMLTHMIPESSPQMLLPLMTYIETISNMIRPWSLAIRLTANMITGHLLISLMGKMMPSMNNMPLTILQSLLMMIETATSMIQAYVFYTLSSLYMKETHHEQTPPMSHS